MKKKYFIVYRCVSAIINLNPNNIYIFDKQATHLAHVIKKKTGPETSNLVWISNSDRSSYIFFFVFYP